MYVEMCKKSNCDCWMCGYDIIFIMGTIHMYYVHNKVTNCHFSCKFAWVACSNNTAFSFSYSLSNRGCSAFLGNTWSFYSATKWVVPITYFWLLRPKEKSVFIFNKNRSLLTVLPTQKLNLFKFDPSASFFSLNTILMALYIIKI